MSLSIAVNFSREDEVRLTSLTKQLEAEGRTSFDDPTLQAEFEKLSKSNDLFLEEGERRLNNARKDHAGNASASGASSSPMGSPASVRQQQLDGQQPSRFEKAKSGLYFWTTLVGKAVPACVNTVTGVLPSRQIWHFITDQLVLGGVPVVTKVGSSGNHLSQLHTQIKDRVDPDTKRVGRYQLGLVVACLTQEELDGYGMPVIEFAQKFHWYSEFGTGIMYAHVPMPDTTSDVSMDVVRKAVDLIHDTVSENLEDALIACEGAVVPPKRVAYIHCKAGVGRSWMVLMCYLVTYGGRSYANAYQFIKATRPFVNPSPSQEGFVKDFAIKFEADEQAKRLMAGEEE